MTDETTKLQQHLSLLRSEYVKLQSRFALVERNYSVLAAETKREVSEDNFAARLMKIVANLFDKKEYSDVTIRLENGEILGHMFVLRARSDVFENVNSSEIDWSSIPHDVGQNLVRWIYTDAISFDKGDTFTLALMKKATELQLKSLVKKCEDALMASVNVKNCVRFYATADEIGAANLREHCSQLISSHWNDFTSEDFAHMTAPLLYTMFKSKTDYPLHSAIRLKREDVVFLYLVEFNSSLSEKLNSLDDRGFLPLDLALSSRQEDLAKTLIEHRVDVNARNAQGETLLHIAIKRDDEYSSLFLLDHGSVVNASTPLDENTPLHLAAQNPGLIRVSKDMIERRGADINAQNNDSFTPLHFCIVHKNVPVFNLLLSRKASLEIKSTDGYPPLWYALQHQDDQDREISSLAAKLVEHGASLNTVCGSDSNSLLHLCALHSLESAGIFLVEKHCDLSATNRGGESALHLAAVNGLAALAKVLLAGGANPNTQTVMTEDGESYRNTPLHLGILHKQRQVIQVFLDFFKEAEKDPLKTLPNFNLKNSLDQTPLALALAKGFHDIAIDLLKGGASVNVTNADGLSLLHLFILDHNSDGSKFLLDNGADVDFRTSNGETPLELAVKNSLDDIVELLCRKGADLSAAGSRLNPPLWIALEQDKQDIASALVRHGVDTDHWSAGPDGCQQTLLHRAIDENLEATACFLVRSGCDINSPRRPGPDGGGGEEAHDMATPLHLCCQWGLEGVVNVLLEHGAFINAKDIESKTPLHYAIENGHSTIINLLLACPGLDLTSRDKSGLSPFATAMTFKNNRAAQKILEIEPSAAEQYDNRGRNFLHTAILKDDLESVLFLLSIHVNVHSRTQDANLLSPLLLAVQKGNDMVVRNLLLAGASVSDVTTTHQTALHITAENNFSGLTSILLSTAIDFNAVDNRGNNALHVAVKEGNLNVVRTLLTESHIDAEAVNNKGRNPLHVLANFGRENSAAIFDLFVECMPTYPVDTPDEEGNTALLLAYTKGNGSLCRALVKAGATLGTMNRNGVSIFNCQVATKQLLYRLLDFLSQEPKWGEGDVCEECTTKFSITTRRHHCRHCGRLLCGKCSDKDMPILKYDLSKPVRVCDVCADVLTIGPGMAT